jgi:hypothetical protein
LKRNPEAAKLALTRAASLDGILSATVSTVTGTLTIHYDPATISLGGVVTAVTGWGYAPAPIPAAGPTAVVPSSPVAGREALLKAIAGALFEKLLERSAMGLVAAL